MDAVTSFELEAQRRRETIASDRGVSAWALATASAESVETVSHERMARTMRMTRRRSASVECQPAAATR
jgi:hypothetical protein